MAIKGNYKDIDITDIIQLIARDRKSGCLIVNNADEKIKIYFFEGQIVFVDMQDKAAIIGKKLVNAGFVTNENLQIIQREQKKTKELIYKLIVDMDLVNFDTARNFLLNQIIEDIYSIFLWKDGYYNFETLNDIPYKEFKIEINAESLLLDGARVLDEYKRVKEKIVSEEVILEKIDLEKKPNLSPEETIIYELIDGNYTVNEIIGHTLISKFDVYQIIDNFFESNLICKQLKKSGLDHRFKFDFILPYIHYIHWEGLFHNIIMLAIVLLSIFYCFNNFLFIKTIWNRMTVNTYFITNKAESHPSTIADTFYRLEYGPWPNEKKLRNIK